MIIPLYNLQAHNVLTNVVVDAGTDAKIAKFQRRGLEIIGLAMLEPVEVWAGASFDSTPPRQSEYLSSTQQQQQQQHPSLQTPTSSALSLTSDSHTFPESLPPNPSTPTAQQEARGSARKFIGKIFRRKGADNPSSSPSYNTHSQPSSPFISESTPRSIKRSSLLAAAASTLTQRMPSPATANFLPGTPTRSQNVSEGGGSGGGGRDAGRDAGREGGSGEGYANATSTVLGIQPILNSPVIPPKGKHPKMYVWVVRRWLKGGNLDGIFSGLTSLPGSSSSTNGGGGGQVEVRFEWTRSKGKKEKKKEGQRERKESLGIPSNTPSTSSLSQLPPPPPPPSSATAASLAKLKAEKSTSAMRKSREGSGRRSVSPNPPASVNTHTTNSTEDRSHSPTNRPLTRRVEDEDPGEESDSEDSETPWTCTLTLRPSPSSYTSYSSRSGVYPQHLTSPLPSTTSQSHSQSQHPQQPPQHEIRIKVGAVVPTPHHPKVVSLLKIPFPLPDIEVDKVVVRKRVVTPAGVARPMLSPVEPSTAGSTKEGEGEGGGENRGFGGFGGMRQGQGSKSVPMSPFGSAFGKGSSGGGGGGSGGGSGGGGGGTGIVLTAEEIKDVVCCTGLWLVVREGFGGVGKEKRKGDGWRIRG